MKEYMEAMDRELAKTAVGKSFIREGDLVAEEKIRPTPPPRHKKSSTTKPSQSTKPESSSMPGRRRVADDDNIDDEDDDFRPVNVDLNTVKNLLESYESQYGLAGPASNILGSMGVRLPPSDDI
jgi:hypothetical protein